MKGKTDQAAAEAGTLLKLTFVTITDCKSKADRPPLRRLA